MERAILPLSNHAEWVGWLSGHWAASLGPSASLSPLFFHLNGRPWEKCGSVSCFWVCRGERERERHKICKGGEEKPSSPAFACLGEEDGKQCHQNNIVKFCRCKITVLLVKFLSMNSLTEYIRRNNVHRWFHVWSLLLSVKKPDSFIDGKCTQQKIFPLKIYRWNYSVCISIEKSSTDERRRWLWHMQ